MPTFIAIISAVTVRMICAPMDSLVQRVPTCGALPVIGSLSATAGRTRTTTASPQGMTRENRPSVPVPPRHFVWVETWYMRVWAKMLSGVRRRVMLLRNAVSSRRAKAALDTPAHATEAKTTKTNPKEGEQPPYEERAGHPPRWWQA